ncbi:G-type lectin S-receptor-like serine/threonine-protein kinase B120 isoform X1 [Cinnamomum micranthum f. kanehirae]|uniref:G-type lectin S-receptor-like serine/threonine-protein kinase B120 isoform X1 n=1 Tax=Cinnamomum micranthum f. kanehirae TaxID=337451 RepID=A0A443PBZ0_9MAGN|nr:G-type lectin S-receptor-like serine/threonine-protein kinase B120 isoform X1 [Cinnamomum micranthum f. kanehirae]
MVMCVDMETTVRRSCFRVDGFMVGRNVLANGYMAPGYAMAGFGVLLLEIVSRKRNTSQHLPRHAQSLLAYAWRLWCDGEGLEQMDDLIQETSSASEVLRCIHIGLLCVREDPADRPTMSSLVVMSTSDSVALPQPTSP